MGMHTNFQSKVDCLWNLSKTDPFGVNFFPNKSKLKSSFSACRCTFSGETQSCCILISQSEGISADPMSIHRSFTEVRITVSFSSEIILVTLQACFDFHQEQRAACSKLLCTH